MKPYSLVEPSDTKHFSSHQALKANSMSATISSSYPIHHLLYMASSPVVEHLQGYFRVDGYAEFHSCDNVGGGENSPGRGGAIFNAANGSILFEGGVLIEDTAVTVTP